MFSYVFNISLYFLNLFSFVSRSRLLVAARGGCSGLLAAAARGCCLRLLLAAAACGGQRRWLTAACGGLRCPAAACGCLWLLRLLGLDCIRVRVRVSVCRRAVCLLCVYVCVCVACVVCVFGVCFRCGAYVPMCVYAARVRARMVGCAVCGSHVCVAPSFSHGASYVGHQICPNLVYRT